MNNKYLIRKKLDIESEKNEPFIIKNFIENDCEKKDNIKKDKNLFDGSFEDLSLDGQDNNIMNQSKEKINDFLSDDNYDVKEKKFKDLLNNENINRESITLDIDSQNGINRISQIQFYCRRDLRPIRDANTAPVRNINRNRIARTIPRKRKANRYKRMIRQ